MRKLKTICETAAVMFRHHNYRVRLIEISWAGQVGGRVGRTLDGGRGSSPTWCLAFLASQVCDRKCKYKSTKWRTNHIPILCILIV